MNGGCDVNVRQLAADGVTMIGCVIGVDDTMLGIDANANQILSDADAAYPRAACVPAADHWARDHSDVGLAPDEPALTGSPHRRPSLNPARSTYAVKASPPSSGLPVTNTTTRGSTYPFLTSTAGPFSSEA